MRKHEFSGWLRQLQLLTQRQRETLRQALLIVDVSPDGAFGRLESTGKP